MEEQRHKNFGFVSGIPKNVTFEGAKRKKRYLSFEVMCPGHDGSLTAYGRMRGDETELKSFHTFCEKNPGSPVRLKGVINQFTSNDEGARRLTNFTFFRWEPAVTGDYKAAFVVIGELLGKDISEGEGMLTITISRPTNQEGEEQTESEPLVFHVINSKEIEELTEGSLIEIKGKLRPRTPESEYGEATSPIRPYVEKIRIIG